MPRKRKDRIDIAREIVLLFIGGGGFIFEGAVRAGEPRIALLFAYGSMLGLSAFMENGRRKRIRNGR